MFQLSKEEAENSRSHFVTLKQGQNFKYLPYAFTEMGVTMLSSVLKSPKAIQANIQIMRTFTHLRQLLLSNADIRRMVETMEKKYDHQFKVVFEAISLNRAKG